MKKKILFTLTLVCLFVCLFALAVSAENADQYIEFKVMLEGDVEYTTVYATNSHDVWNPGVTMTYDFYTDAERTTAIDKTKIVRLDFSENVVHTTDEKNSPVRNSSMTRLVGDGSNPLTNVTHIYFPKKVSDVPNNMCKGWTSLTTIDFGGATKIGDNAFEGCTFTEFTVPEQITQINNSAFKNCTQLETVNCSASTLGGDIFGGCTALKNANLTNATSLYATFKGCTSLESFTIPSTVTSMTSTFESCTSLTSIEIPSNVKEVNYNTFNNCSALTSITFNEGLTKLSGGSIFSGTAITELRLPNSLETVSGYGFAGASKLTTVYYSANIKTIGEVSFSGCSSLRNVYIPASFYGEGVEMGNKLFTWGANDGPYPIVFHYTGTKAQADALVLKAQGTSLNNKLSEAVVMSLADYQANGTSEKYTIVYGYSACEVFYNGEHLNPEKTYSFADENAKYFSELCSSIKCDRCVDDSPVVECGPLFTSKGYSKSENNIVFVIKVNTDAVAEYNLKTGANVKYGIVVSPSFNGGDLITQEGKVQDNSVLNADFTGTNYSMLQIKITGILSDNYATELHCCAYIVDNAGVTYLYEKDKKAATGKYANLISYEKIA